ncbi:hypothetical protein QFZ94_005739 [Paraburkholderia sp. JPY465]
MRAAGTGPAKRWAAPGCERAGAGSRTFYQACRGASYWPVGQAGRAPPLW